MFDGKVFVFVCLSVFNVIFRIIILSYHFPEVEANKLALIPLSLYKGNSPPPKPHTGSLVLILLMNSISSSA
jgi:hypothetical protein